MGPSQRFRGMRRPFPRLETAPLNAVFITLSEFVKIPLKFGVKRAKTAVIGNAPVTRV